MKFLLTRPSRGATNEIKNTISKIEFLLTRPSRGATVLSFCWSSGSPNFYSHAPRGARPQYIEYLLRPHPIYREKRNLNQISCAFGAHFFFFIMANIAVFIEHHRFARRSTPSNNNRPLRIISFLHADMLDFLFPMIPQIIESHAICIFIHNFQKFLF